MNKFTTPQIIEAKQIYNDTLAMVKQYGTGLNLCQQETIAGEIGVMICNKLCEKLGLVNEKHQLFYERVSEKIQSLAHD